MAMKTGASEGMLSSAHATPLAPGSLSGLFCLSAATLLFEITLTRLFSVAQFYHFAFMIISLAMLGTGASGTLLALFPHLGRRHPRRTCAWLALGYGIACIAAYLFINRLPFDSFSIAWDRRQALILAAQYIALSIPFFCSGAALGLLFVEHPATVGHIYATNLAGSALGCVLALVLPGWVGGEGIVWLSGVGGGVAALSFILPQRENAGRVADSLCIVAAVVLNVGGAVMLILRPPALELRLSPYKSLSYALQFPGARVIWQRWNGFSRVDVVESAGIRSLPGLSYRYMQPPPPQRGLFVDGDDLNPILTLNTDALESSDLAFSGYLPTAVAYQLRPAGTALVVEPRGGLEIWVALAQGAAHITAVEANPLIVAAAGDIYQAPHVTPVLEDARSFIRRTSSRYDVISLALTTPYHPIRSGAYSLAEDYQYTVEAFRDALHVLAPGGVFVVTRWLQTPPSESLRAFALAVTAVEQTGGNPAQQIVAFRGYATMTLLVKTAPFTSEELSHIRRFAAGNAFDMVYAPDIRPEEVNRYNVLAEPLYYQTFTALLNAGDRAAWYAAYPFDVTPPTDAHPFFGHFFKGSQARQVLAEWGTTWQPFGGAGYFVLAALLILASVAAMGVILLPVLVTRRHTGNVSTLMYFGLLGLGFMLVEVPLMQRFILFLGHPAYAMTTVLFALLFFSGIGSALAGRFSVRVTLGLLVGLIVAYAVGLPALFAWALALPLGGRMIVTVAALAPGGVLMGMPFPQGLRRLGELPTRATTLPWAWGVNGALSVVASVLAAMLALSFGFDEVLIGGALCYAGAWLAAGQGGDVGAPVIPTPVKGTKLTPPRL
ncbi:MAG TPA: hypothetical protein PLH19_00695 [Anaerolineae bacterium]|nr:hypothetical protein [Anaerolineae bacterium]HQH37037.1 hypothetical protein [Anaerolineae bacterium]